MNDSLDPILQQEEQRKLRTQLIWRLAIAAALVAGVLGTLAWLDQEKEQKPQVTVAPQRTVRIAPRASALAAPPVVVASTPTTASATIASSAQQAEPTKASAPIIAKPQASAVQPAPIISKPAVSPAPAIPLRTAPVVTPAPRVVTPLITKPVSPIMASPVTPTKPVTPARPVITNKLAELTKPVEPVQTAPRVAAESALPTPDKLARQAAAPAVRYPAPVATPNGYTVQAGVFLHSSNAEKMLKQVQGAGVPAYLETRVQIGPFSNKIEAEAAVRKLRQLGLEPVIKAN